MRSWLSVVVLACALSTGCGGPTSGPGQLVAPAGVWWNHVLRAVADHGGWALERVHDGSGWLLGKNQVSIEQLGPMTHHPDGSHTATYRVTVSRSTEKFAAEISAVPCDELGVPHESAQAKFAEAVDKIKAMLDRLQ